MDTIFNQFGDWLKSQIIPVLMAQLRAMYDGVNAQVDSVSSQAGMTPARFSPQVFNMIKSESRNVLSHLSALTVLSKLCQ